MILKRTTYLLLMFCFLFTQKRTALAQGMYTTFGQNRVQYGAFEWSFVRAENFDAFFYSGGRELAQFAARTAETHLNDVERIVDHRLSTRVEIICYNNLSDYKQANFGLTDEPINTGGYSQVSANKMFVYFDGNHAHLQQQIRAGLALVLINELLFGGSIQERIQNAALISLPDWFLFGLTGHIGNKWTIQHDNKLKDLIKTKKVKKFNRLVYYDAELAGLSFWKFLTDKYGEEVISNMVYVTRISRNYESALLYLTGDPMKKISKDWMAYYADLYAKDDTLRQLPNEQFKLKKRLQPYIEPEMKVSPKGDYVSFTTNKYGKYKVWLLNTKTGKLKKIHKGGIKYHQHEIDKSFPILTWHPGGEKLVYISEKKGKIFLNIVDLVNKKTETIWLVKFDKVTAVTYSDNERTLVFTAIRKGQSDLYSYDLKTRREKQLTNDIYDELHPRFVDNSTKIIFSSNRNTDSLNFAAPPVLNADNNFDVYLLDLENSGPRMKRLTYTPYINEVHPIEYNKDYYAYLTDYNGIQNRYVTRIESQYDFTELIVKYHDTERSPDTLYFDELKDLGSTFDYKGKTIVLDTNVSGIDTVVHEKDIVYTYPITNYPQNILAHDISKQTQLVYEVVLDKNKYSIRKSPVVVDIVSHTKKTETFPTMSRLKTGVSIKPFSTNKAIYSDRRFMRNETQKEPTLELPSEPVKQVYDHFFVSEFTSPTLQKEDIAVQLPSNLLTNGNNQRAIKITAPRFYDVTFFSDYFVTQLDNSIINTYYQPITADGQNLFSPGLNGMFNLGMVDLFEDYRLSGGFRLALDLSGVDYFLAYETLKKRLDHKITFYRQVRGGTSDIVPVRNTSHEIRYQIRYPFNPVWSVRVSAFGRMDRDVFRAVNTPSLEQPDNFGYWGGGKAELVFDNAIPKGLNLWNGTKFKIFYERYQNIERRDVQLNALGFDFRHYQKIHRQLIFATRLTANTSFGPAKVRYVMGGVDNWLFAQYDNENNSLGTQQYAFQALATNMRGFRQNIRNGNSFAVMNAEMRWPMFSYLFNRPIRSDFLNHFQVVPFFDVGTAWIGSDPYSDDNTFNQKIVEVSYLRATVINVREPIIMGYGSGLRTKLLGYFMRFDVAWGVQDMEVSERPTYHFSLSLDF